jgi:hypothetical protein
MNGERDLSIQNQELDNKADDDGEKDSIRASWTLNVISEICTQN